MSFRVPQSLPIPSAPEDGAGILDVEIRSERAAALGRSGRDVEIALTRLRDFDAANHDTANGHSSAGDHGSAARAPLVKAAADAVWGFLVHRELCGLHDREQVIRDYAVPREVLVRLGAR